jgi:hypothetical protein
VFGDGSKRKNLCRDKFLRKEKQGNIRLGIRDESLSEFSFKSEPDDSSLRVEDGAGRKRTTKQKHKKGGSRRTTYGNEMEAICKD